VEEGKEINVFFFWRSERGEKRKDREWKVMKTWLERVRKLLWLDTFKDMRRLYLHKQILYNFKYICRFANKRLHVFQKRFYFYWLHTSFGQKNTWIWTNYDEYIIEEDSEKTGNSCKIR
jgi:hypothetical protein